MPLQLSFGAASKHARVLESAGLVRTPPEIAPVTVYTSETPGSLQHGDWICPIAESTGNIDYRFQSMPPDELIPRDQRERELCSW
jgi:hypothetical protein